MPLHRTINVHILLHLFCNAYAWLLTVKYNCYNVHTNVRAILQDNCKLMTCWYSPPPPPPPPPHHAVERLLCIVWFFPTKLCSAGLKSIVKNMSDVFFHVINSDSREGRSRLLWAPLPLTLSKGSMVGR